MIAAVICQLLDTHGRKMLIESKIQHEIRQMPITAKRMNYGPQRKYTVRSKIILILNSPQTHM